MDERANSTCSRTTGDTWQQQQQLTLNPWVRLEKTFFTSTFPRRRRLSHEWTNECKIGRCKKSRRTSNAETTANVVFPGAIKFRIFLLKTWLCYDVIKYTEHSITISEREKEREREDYFFFLVSILRAKCCQTWISAEKMFKNSKRKWFSNKSTCSRLLTFKNLLENCHSQRKLAYFPWRKLKEITSFHKNEWHFLAAD